MLKRNRIPLLILLICSLEGIIYLWAARTTEAGFVFDKCARNSGRASSAINLSILLMLGYYGLKKIYSDKKKKDTFRILISLFAINHLIHFFYVFQNFKNHSLDLSLADNKHGFITFIFILIVPLVLWGYKNLNKVLYIGIILHLFNVSYFIMETFYSKIKPDNPAYHNQLGIAVMFAALFYILYRIFYEIKVRSVSKN